MSNDALAPCYEWLERLVYGGALQRARLHGLATWRGDDPSKVLVLGDGDGRFLECALARWPAASFVSIDASAGMERLARRRGDPSRVRFVHRAIASGLAEIESNSADLVVSHFFLDCFEETSLRAWVPEIRRCLRPGRPWLVSEFDAVRWWQRAGLWVMYRFFRLTTETKACAFPTYRPLLRDEGWTCQESVRWWGGFLVSECWR